jgi:mono/diheme cytochrome c family protein
MLKVAFFCVLSVLASGAALAADPAAGKAIVDSNCSKCHVKADRKGQDAAALEAAIKDVVAGKTKHKKKLQLTDAQIADIAAYWVKD